MFEEVSGQPSTEHRFGWTPQGTCNSQLVLEEPSSIVQLDYSQKVLLISTLQRSLLFYTEEKSVRQIGTQARKR